jgi:UDP-sulfoquinovose synthase
VFNQVTEVFTVNELAERVANVGRRLGYPAEVSHLENPRKELEEHYYNPKYSGLLDLGLTPNYLTDEGLENMFSKLEKLKPSINRASIFRGVKWR